jgi:Fur family ferric uptake transcriptional regulator
MSCEETTMQALKESGQRLTPQRLMVASAVRHAEDHVTAAEILEQVKESYPYIDVSTVYRSLSVLKDMRLVSETDMGGGEQSYEWIEQERHHHLICRSCDRVTLLDHRYVHDLGTAIAGEYGFRADMDHFAIFGFCQECRQRLERMLVGEE